jgi:hypothetical protein
MRGYGVSANSKLLITFGWRLARHSDHRTGSLPYVSPETANTIPSNVKRCSRPEWAREGVAARHRALSVEFASWPCG